MFSVLRNSSKYCAIPILTDLFTYDKTENATPTEQKADRTDNEDGLERVKRIFRVNEFGEISHEANSILSCAAMSCFVGAIVGGTIRSRNAYHEFMRNNEATTFQHHFEAKKKLQDAVTIAFGKGAFKFGWRLTLFSTTFVAITTIIQTYRGKSGIGEYVAAGGLAGFAYKFNMGPRGWIVGGGLGSFLGLLAGGITLGLLRLTGMSVEESRYWQYRWRDTRNTLFDGARKKSWDADDFAVIKLHNEQVGKSGENIENLESTVNKENK